MSGPDLTELADGLLFFWSVCLVQIYLAMVEPRLRGLFHLIGPPLHVLLKYHKFILGMHPILIFLPLHPDPDSKYESGS
jgi:hypothetical protein